MNPNQSEVRKEAHALWDKFSGRIANSRLDPTSRPKDISGYPVVLFPRNTDDVGIAVKLQQLTNSKAVVRSGCHVMANDELEDGTNRILVDMRYLKGIEIEETKGGKVYLKVGVATTTSELAAFLVDKELFLPLGDNPSKSIVSSVMSSEAGLLQRSAGLLQDYVTRVIFVDGAGQTQTSELNSSVEDCSNIVTNIIFDCKKKNVNETPWMTKFYFPYAKKEFLELMEFLFVGSSAFVMGNSLLGSVDLNVHVFIDRFDIPQVCVTIGGANLGLTRDKILKEVDAILRKTLPSEWYEDCPIDRVSFTDIVEVVQEMSDGGFAGAKEYPDKQCTNYERKFEHGDERQDALRATNFCDLIDLAVGRGDKGELFPGIKIVASASLTKSNDITAEAYLYLPKILHSHDLDLKQLMERAMPPKQSRRQRDGMPPLPSMASAALFSREVFNVRERAKDGFDDIFVTPESLIPPKSIVLEERIPDFLGDVFMKGDDDYKEKSHVYATTSYPKDRTSPHMVAYPKDAMDVAAAIHYAKNGGYSIVPRSGGHQYSAHSSGGHKTIVLSMDLFNKLRIDRENIATVGVGCPLKDIADLFAKYRVTIPHGECPLVCIGGHVQSGGYGHLLRSFGLALDHVKAFDIVLSTGELKTIRRPGQGTGEDQDEIYWGVLGGGPGSFGVLTEIVFECIKDRDHPQSFGFSYRMLYERNVFQKTMEEAKKWTEKVTDNPESLPPDVDMMVTAISKSFVRPRHPAGLLVEMVHGNKSGTEMGQAEAQEVFEDTIDAVKRSRRNPLNVKCVKPEYDTRNSGSTIDDNEKRRLSFMSNSFVRQLGSGTTDDGREFMYPYKKRMNCTMKALSQDFVDKLTDIVTDAINEPYIRLVFQMMIGGGEYRNSSTVPLTAIAHRNIAFGFVFDIFYKKGKETKAEEFQSRMEGLLPDFNAADDDEIRMQWGSFDKTTMEDVWGKYYDNKEHFERVRALKAKLDPENVFNTPFTVPLPQETSSPAEESSGDHMLKTTGKRPLDDVKCANGDKDKKRREH